MRRLGALAAVSLLLAGAASAQTLPALFQKAKAQVKGESWKQALETLATLEAEADKPGQESARQQLAAPLAFYRAVCEANLGNADAARRDFAVYLAAHPDASMDPSMYSKKALAAFEAARRDGAPPGVAVPRNGGDGPSVFLAFQEFKMRPNPSEPVNADWAEGPIQWIMTAEERRHWAGLTPGGEWQEFVDRFWEARNPNPGNPDNVARTTFERRVAFADAHFVEAERIRGSLTERGMVFVLLGPPTYVGRKPIRSGEDVNEAAGLSTVGSRGTDFAQRALTKAGEPAGEAGTLATDAVFGPGVRAVDSSPSWREVWHYRRELLPKSLGYQQVDVEFITRKGSGASVLQREPTALATLDAARFRLPAR
jgi:GWxTD domain-containing protein